ncbi:hypothetical protein UPYG_G00029870 [Umbra pygmaea]|uniref:SMB domain-containing protein n=1 Tax=Umbra pygmaea TaxID=75934 RepID=A0ABD0YBK2_UMBPY
MTTLVCCVLVLLVSSLPFSWAQSSCSGRCGGEYYRGYMCQCDYDCLTHNECCKDYESQCTTSDSCKGRCGESFKRGRVCDCDVECSRYKKCCPDYTGQCGTEDVVDDIIIPSINPNLQDEQEVDVKSGPSTDLPVLTGSEEHEAFVNPESTSGSEFSPTELPTDIFDPSLETTSPLTDLEGGNEPFFETFPPEAKPSPEAETSTSPAKPVSEDPNQATVSSNPEGELDPSSSPSLSNPTPSRSSSGPTPTAPAISHPSDQGSPTLGPSREELPGLLPKGQTELDPEGQEEESGKPTTSNPENATTTPATTEASKTEASTTANPGPTQETPLASEDPGVATASQEGTTHSTTPDQTSSTTGASPSSDRDSPKEDALTTIPPEPQDPSVTSQAPTGSGGTRGDNSFSQTVGLTTHSSSDYMARPTSPMAKPTDPVRVEERRDELPPDVSTRPKLIISKPTEKPKPTKPIPLHDINQAVGKDNPRDYQADEHNNTNLCSGHPVGAVTTLKNGTVVVFRGHYFWMLDSNKVPGPARGVTDVWGVPSPVDTVFTRCNCQGKTYFFKGAKYWRFENDMLDPGFPKLISLGFDGLQGQVTAALSVPRYRKRRESVFFFKRGGLVQKYSYESGTSPTCGTNVHSSIQPIRNRIARQAVSLLGPIISIRLTWRGFPSTVTSAVSIPAVKKPEGYSYHLFSRSNYYNINMVDERPVIATQSPITAAKDFFNCPKEV